MKNTKIWKVLQYIRYELFYIQYKTVYKLDITGMGNEFPASEAPLSFRKASLEEIKALSRDEHDYDTDDHRFSEKRFKLGDNAIIGYIDNHPVAYGWQMLGEMELSYEKYIKLNPAIVYSYKVFVVESQRKKGILRKYYNFISSYYARKGFNSIIATIDNRNIASTKAHLKAGFTKVGTITTIKLGLYTYNFYNLVT